MYHITFHPEAEAEFIESHYWFEAQQAGLGSKFERAIEETLQKVVNNPVYYSYSETGYRRLLVKGFPFVVGFAVDVEAKSIFIASVFHTSRDPQKKFRK